MLLWSIISGTDHGPVAFGRGTGGHGSGWTFGGLLAVTVAQVRWGSAGSWGRGWEKSVGDVVSALAGGGAAGAAGGDGAGVAVWIILKRESLCSSATLIVGVTIFATSTGSLS